MKCYICEHKPGPGGTHYHVREAIGICHDCGIGICELHAEKDTEPGSPLLCPQCTQLRDERQLQGQDQFQVLLKESA